MPYKIPSLHDFNVKRTQKLLSNGVRMVVFERAKTPIFIQALFDAGSIYDPKGKEGLAHFVEHMVVAGTKKYKSKDRLARYFEQYGGIFGARTGGETIAINMEIGEKEDLDKAIKLMSEMINESLFNKKILDTEKGSILNEIGLWKADPGRYIWELWRSILYQDTVKGRPILGTNKTVASIVKDDVINYVNKYFVAGRTLICISGGVSAQEVAQTLKSRLILNKSKNGIRYNDISEIRKRSTAIAPYPQSKHIHLLLGFRTCSEFHSDTIALRIIALVLGGGRAAKLLSKLRYEKGLVYGASAVASGSSNTGAWFVKTSTSKENVEEVLKIVTDEITKVRSKGITKTDLKFAKDKYLKSVRRRMQTSGEWVGFHSFGELYNQDKYLTLDEYLREISKVTNTDIIRVSKKYFKSNKWYLAVCGDVSQELKVTL